MELGSGAAVCSPSTSCSNSSGDAKGTRCNQTPTIREAKNELLCKSQTDTRKADEYAMSEDFCRLFKEDAEGLYLLSYMLMADQEKAERCFVGGLEDSVNGNSVYKQWARSWARRRIIQCAIRTIAPGLQHADDELNVEAESEGNPALAAILHLAAFERFVFVMSTLEGYS